MKKLLRDMLREEGTFYGPLLGEVSDNKDPLKVCRIRAIVPEVAGDFTTDWIYPSSQILVGKKSGAAFIPEVGAKVIVSYRNGDPNNLGFWRPGVYPQPNGQSDLPDDLLDGYPESFGWVTPGGHKIKVNDKSGEIEITHAAGDTVAITPGRVTVRSTSSVVIQGPSDVRIN